MHSKCRQAEECDTPASPFELEYLIELIGWRLKLCDAKPDEFNRDNEFYWRFRLRGREVPMVIEEGISAVYDQGDLDRAEAVLRLLVDTFEDDAESHNYLGMIALKRGNLDEAARRFTMMMELARKRLPRRLTPRLFRDNHRGKPYRRGLSNLIITLNRLGQHDKALAHADQLEGICGDCDGAEYYRALIHLNRGAWEDAARAARHVRNLWQETSFVAALASFEIGRLEECSPADIGRLAVGAVHGELADHGIMFPTVGLAQDLGGLQAPSDRALLSLAQN